MKKKIFVVCVLLVLIVAGVFIFTLTRKNDSATAERESFEQKLISISNFAEFDDLVSDRKLNVFYSKDKKEATLMEFSFWSSNSEMAVYFDEESNVESFRLYVPAYDFSEWSPENSDGKIEGRVYDACQKTIDDFSGLFGVNYDQSMRLTNYDGTFSDVESADDIVRLINGDSYINFAVRDQNGYYYVMQIILFESMLEVEIMKYLDVNEYMNYFANISLYENEEF